MAEINGEEKRIGVSGEQIEEVVGKMPAVEADVKENKQNISALQTASAQHTADIAKNTADIALKANAEDVYSKDETDSAITAKVAEIVAGAPEEFDTLQEMSDWLTEHSDSAATMNTAIQANTKAIADNAKAIEENTANIEANTAEIESNKSDILLAEKAIKINRLTLGTQATKNVLKTNKINQTMNGITAITNDDGSIHVTGTATHLTYFNLYSDFTVPESANYVLSGCPTGGGSKHYQLYLTGDTTMYDSGIGATGYIEASHKMSVYIFIAENKTVDLMFYPMLRNANITDSTYEPHISSLQEQINTNKADVSNTEKDINILLGYFKSMFISSIKNLGGTISKQLFDAKSNVTVNGTSFVFNNGIATITGTATANGGRQIILLNRNINLYTSNKYLIKIPLAISGNSPLFYISDSESNPVLQVNAATGGASDKIITVDRNLVGATFGYNVTTGTTYNLSGTLALFDLTAMFGAGNEPTIEQFNAMFPDEYYPFTE